MPFWRRGARAIMPQEIDAASPQGHLIEGAAVGVAKRLMRKLTQR
jgi:hypothetical protein